MRAHLVLAIAVLPGCVTLQINGPSGPEDVAKMQAKAPGRNSVALNLGLGSTVGAIGLTYNRDFAESGQVELGAGAGYSGAVFETMVKAWAGSPYSRWLFGIGFGVGAPGMPLITGEHVLTPWVTTDLLSHEWINSDGGSFLFALGTTTALASGTLHFCNGCGPQSLMGWTVPQFRIAFAQHF